VRDGCSGIAVDPNLGVVVRRALIAAAFLGVVAAVAVPIAVFATGDGEQGPTRDDYLAQVNAICRRYEVELQRIGVPANPANPQIVQAVVSRVLPIVERRINDISAVTPPEAMRAGVTRMLAAADDVSASLRAVLAAARANDVRLMLTAFGAFLELRDEARAQSRALGISC
jgi:hypothetical protein